jgi:hypothetical protein
MLTRKPTQVVKNGFSGTGDRESFGGATEGKTGGKDQFEQRQQRLRGVFLWNDAVVIGEGQLPGLGRLRFE